MIVTLTTDKFPRE